MKNILFTATLLLLTCNSLFSQIYTEVSYGFEDKAIGANIMIGNFIVGAETGAYVDRDGLYDIEHDKFSFGITTMRDIEYKDFWSSFIFTANACYNKYRIKYDDREKKHKLPEWTFELGIKTDLVDRLYCGFNIDFIHQTGSVTIGYMLWE